MNDLKLYGNSELPQDLHTRKLGEIAVFYEVRKRDNKWKPLYSLWKKSQPFLRNHNFFTEHFALNILYYMYIYIILFLTFILYLYIYIILYCS